MGRFSVGSSLPAAFRIPAPPQLSLLRRTATLTALATFRPKTLPPGRDQRPNPSGHRSASPSLIRARERLLGLAFRRLFPRARLDSEGEAAQASGQCSAAFAQTP